ncbi:hypothetical protein BGZ49_007234 [Haplosporangium sp. Z 27]|nr:hypothetical protein BGZ49_007234 [Haplosporangium sp. Z 27]
MSMPGSSATATPGLMAPIGSSPPFSSSVPTPTSSMMPYPFAPNGNNVDPISQQHQNQHQIHQHHVRTTAHQPFQHQGPTMTLLSIKAEGSGLGPMMTSGTHLGGGHPGVLAMAMTMGNSAEFEDTMGLGASIDSMGGGPRGRKRAKIEVIE